MIHIYRSLTKITSACTDLLNRMPVRNVEIHVIVRMYKRLLKTEKLVAPFDQGKILAFCYSKKSNIMSWSGCQSATKRKTCLRRHRAIGLFLLCNCFIFKL